MGAEPLRRLRCPIHFGRFVRRPCHPCQVPRRDPTRPRDADPRLDPFRLPPDGKCWWCGDKATTREHKFKHSDLRRVATRNGKRDLSSLHKQSDFHTGPLRTLKRGDEVKWGLNLCARCNDTKSQPFDMAYDQFVAFLLANEDHLWRQDHLDWADVYGSAWGDGSTNLARYFVKQFGCMMATQHLPVPADATAFLGGAPRCPSVVLGLWRDHRPIKVHRKMKKTGVPDGMLSFVGLPATMAYTDGLRLTGADYQCRVAYMIFNVSWREDEDLPSFHEEQVVPMPLINARLRDRVAWLPVEARGYAHRVRQRWRGETEV